MMLDVLKDLFALVDRGEPAALVTVVETLGSSPAKTGFKMLVGLQGRRAGTVGGGPLEAEAIEEALKAIRNNSCMLYKRELTAAEAGDLGMICGGEVTLFIEPHLSPAALLLVGAGHISQCLAAMAKIVGFTVTVLDDREEFCNRRLFPAADRLLVGDIGQLLEEVEIGPQTHIVIVTRGHRYDQLALEKTLRSPAAYLGMIGSVKKVKANFDNLQELGFSRKELERVHAPVGLRIGALTPAEIAVSILAEIIAVKRGAGNDGS